MKYAGNTTQMIYKIKSKILRQKHKNKKKILKNPKFIQIIHQIIFHNKLFILGKNNMTLKSIHKPLFIKMKLCSIILMGNKKIIYAV